MSNDERYFTKRRPGEARRAAMRAQELQRMRALTGLEGGTVVDIGCGLGELLERLPGARWRKFGVEASETARRTCAEKGISFDLPDGTGWCDLVLFRGSLQHLDRPLDTLVSAHGW